MSNGLKNLKARNVPIVRENRILEIEKYSDVGIENSLTDHLAIVAISPDIKRMYPT